ncbi:hypothetical protein JRO89_XS10G0058400 [Xanthoceras sorbifolium]|uniref:Uncharacterized protein n=1 Tax=Xanthoceras sorbifolium TaxID=99658 RepID=A0ABQ8HI04_9ROSI|nr:hypothetical protein JRO89_XS10G0058400 [Xanthoceras sorbifolium]
MLAPAFSQHCIYPSSEKFPPKLFCGNRNHNRLSYLTKKSVNGGRIQMCLAAETKQEIVRPLAVFPSNIWKDKYHCFFASTATRLSDFEQTYGSKIEELKDMVKEMLITPLNDPIEKISLINSLCRLGVSYHFETEIEEQLNHMIESQYDNDNDYDLYTTALQFRVFRQHGYKMTSSVFNKFKDNDGKFKEALTNDAKGMLSLYEATQLRVHGEDVLEEALAFTKTHLKSLAYKSSPHLAKQINKALKIPFHKGIPRLEAHHYISLYEEDHESRNDTLLLFAKLDFNRLQLLYQQEIRHVTSWWNDLNIASELSYARDRIIEIYFWIVATNFEPYYSHGRLIFTKFLKLMSVVDDTYDAYGIFEELQCFMDAIERWDTSALTELPEYMKILYSTLLDFFEEVNSEITKEGRSYSFSCSKEMTKGLVRAYHQEAEWLNQNYMPTFDEHLSNGIISAGCFAITAITFMGMGEIAGINAFEWLQNRPRLVRSGVKSATYATSSALDATAAAHLSTLNLIDDDQLLFDQLI